MYTMPGFLCFVHFPLTEAKSFYLNMSKKCRWKLLFITASSRKYIPFEQTPAPLFTPKFLYRYFSYVNTSYWASSGTALVSFWFRSVINWVCKHVHTELLLPHLLGTTKVFVARSGNASLRGVFPWHHKWCKLLFYVANKYRVAKISIA